VKGRIRRLERASAGEAINVSQPDGTVKRFNRSAGVDAFMNHMQRLGAGEEAPPEHPLITAARASDDPRWSKSAFVADDPDEWTRPVEDLSE